ncbi:hypothetical protein K466DRAFT_592442 [Polyporus arcularius HHB13444]|uniref:Uncharacterized protein n=1 Tax=Polyporus arcularius HHB13444 TaxID=1314778 RepID=A0A5C3P0R1_9APHY|nr:hypothetical protein K466DRAFT_592442 [Polyporus arcularius HHB13444]
MSSLQLHTCSCDSVGGRVQALGELRLRDIDKRGGRAVVHADSAGYAPPVTCSTDACGDGRQSLTTPHPTRDDPGVHASHPAAVLCLTTTALASVSSSSQSAIQSST